MTSRARRIVLAMYGHRKPAPNYFAWFDEIPASMLPGTPYAHGCYEAMDEPDEIPPARILIGGNYGLPCA